MTEISLLIALRDLQDRGAIERLLTGGAVLGDVSVVDALGEEGRVVVDVLEVDLDVGVAHEAVAAVVLREHREPPLRPPRRLVAVQRLKETALNLF